MTAAKEADRPECKIELWPGKGGKLCTVVSWVDSGSERVAARITKALKFEGYEAHANRIYCHLDEQGRHCVLLDNPGEKGDHRHCGVITWAPLDVVERLVARYFLVLKVDRTIPQEDDVETLGTALDLVDWTELAE